MRVIAGSAKGLRLNAPKGNLVRPTPDRVKEALFSIIAAEIDGAMVLDLFCGSGALGIEALSRGAASATFVDKSAASVRLAKSNLELSGLADHAKVTVAPVASWLKQTETHADAQAERFTLIFLDPPYKTPYQELEEILSLIGSSAAIENEALIVYEHPTKSPPLPIPALELTSDRRYGDTSLAFYRRKEQI